MTVSYNGSASGCNPLGASSILATVSSRSSAMWHKAKGTIVYDPYRAKMKRKTAWWAVVETDDEITRYFRWWVKKEFWIDLNKPAWGAHVSIIRGEKPEPDLMHLWKKYDRTEVEFEYEHSVYQNKHFWLVDVKCPFLINIRKELNRPCNWNLHLTIGRT